jgi:hypothetical protein
MLTSYPGCKLNPVSVDWLVRVSRVSDCPNPGQSAAKIAVYGVTGDLVEKGHEIVNE